MVDFIKIWNFAVKDSIKRIKKKKNKKQKQKKKQRKSQQTKRKYLQMYEKEKWKCPSLTHVQLFATLWDLAPSGSSVSMEFSR